MVVQKPQKPEPPIIFYVFFLSKMGNTCSDLHAAIHVFQLTLHGGSCNAVTILLLWQKLYNFSLVTQHLTSSVSAKNAILH